MNMRLSKIGTAKPLSNQQLFPWLWNLEINAVRERQHAGRWNWELLVRQLSLKKIHEPNDVSVELTEPSANMAAFRRGEGPRCRGTGGETDGREDGCRLRRVQTSILKESLGSVHPAADNATCRMFKSSLHLECRTAKKVRSLNG